MDAFWRRIREPPGSANLYPGKRYLGVSIRIAFACVVRQVFPRTKKSLYAQ